MKTIAKIAIVTALVGGAYFIGLNQRASYQELPLQIQAAVVTEHKAVNLGIEHAVKLFKSGNPAEAYSVFRTAEEQVKQLQKIDPQHKNLEEAISQYGAAIIDTNLVVSVYFGNKFYENIVNGTPERIANYVVMGNPLHHLNGKLEIIGPDSASYHRLKGDKEAQKALLRQYVDNSNRFFDAQEKMRETLLNAPNKTDQIEFAIEVLNGRMPDIQRYREWTDKFEQEHLR